MQPESIEYLSPETIARQLDVGDRVVRNWIKQGELHAIRIGRYERVSVGDFQSFLRRKIADPQVF